MRTTSFLAALVAATAVAGHEQPRPRIYFPRHVKRQFSNVTTTSSASLESKSSSADLTASETRPRADDPISENPRVTTIVISSTIYVPPPSGTGAANTTTGSTSSTDSDAAPISSKPANPGETTSNAQEDEPLPSSDAASSGSAPPTVVLPTTRSTSADNTTPSASPSDPEEPVDSATPTSSEPPLAANTTSSIASDDPVSVIATTTSSTSGILLAPSGIVTSTTSRGPLEPIESLLSSILNPPKPGNTTSELPTSEPPKTTTTTTSVDIEPSISIPSVVPDPTTTSRAQPPDTSDPPPPPSSVPGSQVPVSNSTSLPPSSAPGPTSVITSDFPGSTSVSSEPSTITSGGPSIIPSSPVPSVSGGNSSLPFSTPPSSVPSSIVTPPPESVTSLPPLPVTNSTTSPNATVPADPTTTAAPTTRRISSGSDDVTSVPPLTTVTNTDGLIPTTVILDSASTTVSGIIAPTSASGIPSALPKQINPENWNEPQPEDTVLIQIGFLNSLNYPFVSQTTIAAAQIFRHLPRALGYGSGFDLAKCKVMKLVPLDTRPSLGYLTTLAIVSYPENLVEALQLDVRLANSPLYSNPDQLVYNLTQQINPAIDITYGSKYGDIGVDVGDDGSNTDPAQSPNGDPFGGEGNTDSQTSAQKGATAGIAIGSVGIAAAYGAAMFIIARRYKRKKQAHRRASSISNPSEMRQSSRGGSPALMGGALLSRDFSTYGATSGGVAGGRDSHGSGRSGMGNSARTAYISAPVAAENSLGWN